MHKFWTRVGAAVFAAALSAQGFAGVITSAQADGDGSAPDAFPGTPILVTTTEPDVNSTTSNGGGNGVALTFTTGAVGFTLDQFSIVAAGGAGGNVNIYRVPQVDAEGGNQGGKETDGYVNITLSTPLLGGGAGLPFTFNGTPNETLLTFDLTGADEITLQPNSVYAIDFTNTGNFFVRRGGAFYTGGGNIYSGAGTDRFDVAGGRRDAPLALYAAAPIPEPSSLALLGLGAAALVRRRRA
jgi:hypothetical protein